MSQTQRTPLQAEADEIDCELFRVITRVERMYDGIKRHTGPRVTDLHKSLMGLRAARAGIRMLMSDNDRARTS